MLPFPNVSLNRTVALTENNTKSHAFDVRNGMRVCHEDAPGIGGITLPGQKPRARRNEATVTQLPGYPRNTYGALPAWLIYDRHVLRFEAFFKEAVHESRLEQYRVRRCIIYFYLDDDTIHVAEARQDNSGIPQGIFLKRHRIPKEGEIDAFYGAADFAIGREVTFYGRTFRIINCDGFTRTFMEYLGVHMDEPEDLPADPHTIYRNIMKENMKATRPTKTLHDPLRQFLDWDRKVLRFNAFWDDSTQLFGDHRDFTIFYFLADDTIEVVECIGSNSGRDPFPKFIRRQRIPRTFQGVVAFGAPQAYYNDRDLAVGQTIEMFGRTFFIYNCDPFTSHYYDEKYGIKYRAVPMPQHQEVPVPRELPPHNGFGSEADTVGNCLSLVPKPPVKNFQKLMVNDRKMLRFAGRMETHSAIDQKRSFVIIYFLSDDTISVFEPPQRNSGVSGGKFLERMQLKKPNSSEHYGPTDFYIGATVEFHNFKFFLYEADEYALQFMELHPTVFPMSDANRVKSIARDFLSRSQVDLVASCQQFDRQAQGWLTFQEFRDVVMSIPGYNLTEQVCICVQIYGMFYFLVTSVGD
eukprot:TRINITY_DN3675_c0_g1_i4.p1 TRINITY_DN3675_c0_g1~~TRINITY_DN3675_c0_g1_i4.p1  ORF type:complete len:580 (+),score=122.49 TRINITY_DN3675_c0_g1_i4:80-1819(+)